MTRWLPWAAGILVVWLVAGRGWALAIATAVLVAVWRLRGDTRTERRRRRISSLERRIALHRAGYRCEDCGSGDRLEIDHFVPFVRGGACNLSNFRVLCRTCNARKGDTPPEVYYR